MSPLVRSMSGTLTLVNRRTAGQQRVCESGAAIVLQRTEERIKRSGPASDKIAVDGVREASATVCPPNQVVALRSEITGEVGIEAEREKRIGWIVDNNDRAARSRKV